MASASSEKRAPEKRETITSPKVWPRRFWKEVSIVADQEQKGAFSVLLDHRPLVLPGGRKLSLLSRTLADSVAEEWRFIPHNAACAPDDLTLTRMAGTMTERIAPMRQEVIESLVAYGIDDALCYQSPAQDAALRARILQWAAAQGLVPQVTEGLMPVSQDAAYKAALVKILQGRTLPALAVLGVLAPLMGSLLLPFALLSDVINIKEALAFGFADEQAQLERWGHDDILAENIAHYQREITEAMRFYHLAEQI